MIKESMSKEAFNILSQIKKILEIDILSDEFIKKQKYESLLKYKDVDFTHLIFDGDIEEVKNIKIELEFCETKEQNYMWKYFHAITSSYKTKEPKGRRIRILVKDKTTNKYLGLLCLASDNYFITPRDNLIFDNIKGNKQELLKNNISYLMNIRTCVPLSPFGYNFTGGKLLAELCFSKEVFDYFYKKYNTPLLGLSTFGLYGKAIQYDRLKKLKFIGYTEGKSISHLPSQFIKNCKDFLKSQGFNKKYNNDISLIKTCFKILGINSDVLNHKVKRGIYFGYMFKNSRDIFNRKCDKISRKELEKVDDIFNYWINRWAINRYKNCIKDNKLETIKQIYKLNDKWNEYMRNYRKRMDKNKLRVIDNINNTVKLYKQYEKNTIDINKLNITEEDKEIITNHKLTDKYIAGFFDGDGSIYITNYGSSDYYIAVNFTQCDIRPLITIFNTYNGSLSRRDDNRNQYSLNYTYFNNEKIIDILLKNSIIKYPQILESTNFNYTLEKNVKKELQHKLIQLKQLDNLQKIDDKPYQKIDIDYIAGIFDAEGCVLPIYKYLNDNKRKSNFTLKITQVSNPEILKRIGNYLKEKYNITFGSDNKDLRIYKLNNNLLDDLIERTIVKKEQLILGKKILNTNIFEEKMKIANEIKSYKKRNYDISENILKEVSDINNMTNIKKEIKEEKKQQDEIKKKQPKVMSEEAKKKMSEAKLGKKQKHTDIQDNNISIGTTKSKVRKLFDNKCYIIDEIYEFINKNKNAKQKDIAEIFNKKYKLNLYDEQIGKIAKGLIKNVDNMTDEEILEFNNYKKEVKENNKGKLGKSKYSNKQIYMIKKALELNNSKYKSTVLSKFFSDLFNIEVKPTYISGVKNGQNNLRSEISQEEKEEIEEEIITFIPKLDELLIECKKKYQKKCQ